MPSATAQQPAITSFDLVDTSGNVLVTSIQSDSTIYLSQLSNQHFSVRANVTASPLVGIYFYLTNYYTGASLYSNPVTTSPYFLCGANGSNPLDCSGYLTAGASSCGTTYAVQAVPYTSSPQGSVAGVSSSIRFTIAATPPTGSTPTLSLSQDAPGQNVTVTLTGTSCRIQVDDTSGFNTPILDSSAPAPPGATFNVLNYGLVPGTKYYFRLLPSNIQQAMTVQPSKWSVALPGGASFATYLNNSWSNEGVLWLRSNAGVNYNSSQNPVFSLNVSTNPSTAWSYGYEWVAANNAWSNFEVGAVAENSEAAVTKSLNEIVVYNKTAPGDLMDQLAQFYNAFYGTNANFDGPNSRLMTLSAMQSFGAAHGLATSQLNNSGVSGPNGWNAKTLPNVINNGMFDCYLCNEIFFYPAARLIRLISTVPKNSRTSAMNTFVSNYLPLIRDDQVIRLAYYQTFAPCPQDVTAMQNANPPLANSAGMTWPVAAWTYFTANPNLAPGETNPECRGMFNSDLYLIGMAAELLGANGNDPTNVPLTVSQSNTLRSAYQIGVNFFKTKAHTHSTTDFNGAAATAASYFDGDMSILDDQVYAGFTTDCFPIIPSSPYTAPDVCSNAPVAHAIVPTVGWDISHYSSSVPMFLRTLFDNKKAVGSLVSGFPAVSDIQNAASELAYVSLKNHATSAGRAKPLFNNFVDATVNGQNVGTNGWYRVGYDAPNVGYPPAQDCNNNPSTQYTSPDSGQLIPTSIRPCLTPGTTMEWGLLSNFQPDLSSLQQSLVSLALASDQSSKNFRDQYYYYIYSFSYLDANSQVQYPPSLLNILSLNASQLP